MTFIIVILLVLSYLLIATGHLTGVNKAAIAMFLCTVGWVVYVCWGADFVMQQHPLEYKAFLNERPATSLNVKEFIHEELFLYYVGRAAAIVMFLLATMAIVELLQGNGCFDFLSDWIRTRSSKRVLWTLTATTFVISANLDNLTTATMMLVLMHKVVQSRRQRMLIGSAIVIAANCGGSFTVIGDPTGLILWGDGVVTASRFSAFMMLPALTSCVVSTYFIGRSLHPRLETEWSAAPYRGDDTRLNGWQRFLMLFVGIGGLWFIPTFHNITGLSPFLGALCVLSVLWVVNEAVNRKLMQADQMAARRMPHVLQYGALQQMLFVMGIMLGIGVVSETGVLGDIANWLSANIGNLWLMGLGAALLSAIVDTFTIAVTNISLYSMQPVGDFALNGIYWPIMAYATAVGGCLLSVGSTSGLALMKMEHIRVGWYFKTITPKVLAGFTIGFAILWIESQIL
jgi:Na+/H+ antiporter NhaD/arsenite permease-like protein